jgi:hypothetical protein
MKRLLLLLIFCVSLSACNSLEVTNPIIPAPAASEVNITKENGSSQPRMADELLEIKQSISAHMKESGERHSIRILMLGVGQDHILIQIRALDDVEKTLSETELEAVKKTLFEIAGSEFPLKLSARACCTEEAGITGKITSFDEKENRILIINERKKNGNSDDPEATWVSLQEDGILIVDGSKVSSGLEKSMIGKWAKAWSNGLMLQSYPGQTSAVKIVVEQDNGK